MDIKPIKNKEDYIEFYPWIKECNFTEVTSDQVLANCLNGVYFGYVGFDKEKLVGMAICKDYGDMVFLVGTWCKGNLYKFEKQFFIVMKTKGFKTLRGSVRAGRKFPENIEGLKPLWTVYEKELK